MNNKLIQNFGGVAVAIASTTFISACDSDVKVTGAETVAEPETTISLQSHFGGNGASRILAPCGVLPEEYQIQAVCINDNNTVTIEGDFHYVACDTVEGPKASGDVILYNKDAHGDFNDGLYIGSSPTMDIVASFDVDPELNRAGNMANTFCFDR